MNDFREYKAAFDRKNSFMHSIGSDMLSSLVKKLTGIDITNMDALSGAVSQVQLNRLYRKLQAALPVGINLNNISSTSDLEKAINNMSMSEKAQLVSIVKDFIRENTSETEGIKRRMDRGVDYRKGVKYDKSIGPTRRR